jgi:hypothetical protein
LFAEQVTDTYAAPSILARLTLETNIERGNTAVELGAILFAEAFDSEIKAQDFSTRSRWRSAAFNKGAATGAGANNWSANRR